MLLKKIKGRWYVDTTEVVLGAVELLKDDRAICGIAIRFAVSPSIETGSFSRGGQGHGRSELLFIPTRHYVVRHSRQFIENERITTYWPPCSPLGPSDATRLHLTLSRSSVMSRSRPSRTPSAISIGACLTLPGMHTCSWSPYKLLRTIWLICCNKILVN